ncbi:VOC family protein [Halomarina ordinaria]|uniref:VOC family protein n=1 Tax=Halomarina ordinaria TaxID=3033939 RepID=A0ABD5UAG5_9EURY|nr:VOC family protein [Halomarina sp. PSRA2]
MITAVTHATLLVDDPDEALAFYTEVLGFEKHTDVESEEGRWLTVALPDDELQLVLMPRDGERPKRDDVAFVLATDDCRAEHDRLRAADVAFSRDPTVHPYGVEAGFKDPDGNQLSLLEPAETVGPTETAGTTGE